MGCGRRQTVPTGKRHGSSGPGRSVQIRMELFNATNRVNLRLPVNDLAAPNFGSSAIWGTIRKK